MTKKNIHKVRLGDLFVYRGVKYRRMGSSLKGVDMLTGKPKIFLGTEMVEVYEKSDYTL